MIAFASSSSLLGRTFRALRVVGLIAIAAIASIGQLAAAAGLMQMRAERVGAVTAPALKPWPGRAAWLWEWRIWRSRGDDALDLAESLKIHTLFIALEMKDSEITHRPALRRFIAAAHDRGIFVVAVEGDPVMIRPAGRRAAVARAKVIRAYQSSVPRRQRLDGLQYDFEPYVLPDFDVRDPDDLQRWADTYSALRKAYGKPLDIVLPFWIGSHPRGAAFVRKAAPFALSFTIMAYRNKTQPIIDAATPLLEQGTALGVPVRVALEMGPTDEGDTVSFEGDLQALLKAVRDTRPTLSDWESFAGYAIHGLTWPGQEPALR